MMQQHTEEHHSTELERRRLELEEKRLAAELTQTVIQKNPDWDKDVEYEHEGHEAGKMFAIILSYIREQRGIDTEMKEDE
jgi:hypothetical protein